MRIRSSGQAGDYVLAMLRKRYSAGIQSRKTKDAMNRIYRDRGEEKAYMIAPQAISLYDRVVEWKRQFGYVYRIVDYLCRYRKFLPDGDKFNVGTALQFVFQVAHEEDRTYELRNIQEIWWQTRDAAPYIYAFYRYVVKGRRKVPFETILDFLMTMASNEQRRRIIIGRAAYAADILSQAGVHGVSVKDFKNIARVVPALRRFSEFELAMIYNIDPKAPILDTP
jgi:hypothetical protein